VRRVFVIFGLIAIVLYIATLIDPTGFLQYPAVFCAIIALGASIADTWTTAKEFEQQVKKVETSHKIREIEIYGNVVTNCFEPKDRKDIRRRRWASFGYVLLKIILIVILVALLFQDGISL